jgi:hypothetical protein
VIRRLFPPVAGLQEYESFLRSLTSRCNEFLLNAVEEGSRTFENGGWPTGLSRRVRARSSCFADQLLKNRDAFILRNQEVLIASLQTAGEKVCAAATGAIQCSEIENPPSRRSQIPIGYPPSLPRSPIRGPPQHLWCSWNCRLPRTSARRGRRRRRGGQGRRRRRLGRRPARRGGWGRGRRRC